MKEVTARHTVPPGFQNSWFPRRSELASNNGAPRPQVFKTTNPLFTPKTVAASPFKFQFRLKAVPAEPRPEAPRRTTRTPAPSRRRRARGPRGAG